MYIHCRSLGANQLEGSANKQSGMVMCKICSTEFWSNFLNLLIFVSTAHAQVDTKTEKKFVNLSICNR